MIAAIVTDIEGTTTSVSFVYDVLFPYAREHMASFISAHQDEPAVRAELAAVAQETGQSLTEQDATTQLLAWMDEDRKITPLKALQGMIWEDGYRRGAFTGHIYEDVPRCLRNWHEQGIALYVYSSGSIAAQKLLFGHSDQGDLTPLFSGYFDTTTGNKREPSSYTKIASAIGKTPAEILFLSDTEAELDAAAAAGFQVQWLDRQGGAVQGAYLPVRTFDEIVTE